VTLPTNNNQVIIDTLGTVGPVSVALAAVGFEFKFYSSGLFVSKWCKIDANSFKCQRDPTSLNHAVVLIGYNMTDPDNSYFLLRNSWGTSWGNILL